MKKWTLIGKRHSNARMFQSSDLACTAHEVMPCEFSQPHCQVSVERKAEPAGHWVTRLCPVQRFWRLSRSVQKCMAFSMHLMAMAAAIACSSLFAQSPESDAIARLQQQSVETNQVTWGHWGPNPEKYSSWKTHSNRLIPAYIFGGDTQRVAGVNSVYRNADRLKELYGFTPTHTFNPTAQYFDQTDIYRLQKWAAESGKNRIILFVFDGMDWQTTRAAAIAKSGKVTYDVGRGSGLGFQDYRGAATDFGYFVTSPCNEGTTINVDDQRVTKIGGNIPGGFDPVRLGEFPWSAFLDPQYPIGAGSDLKHAYADSASSATSMTCGIKTYNDAINVDVAGREVLPLARTLQEKGFAVGVVTSVPISHATPAAAYANNIHRDDYQDLTRDLIGLPSIFHPGGLPGVDVLIGAGWGESKDKDGAQGMNFVPGNRYLAAEDLHTIDQRNGGSYQIVQRTGNVNGRDCLQQAVDLVVRNRQRLFGYFGVKGGHLPYRTANGDFAPVDSFGTAATDKAETYSAADLDENPELVDMTLAAAEVLQAKSNRWWLMVEAGDVDWGNHANNIDNSIGAVISGDNAFLGLTKWIETHGGWNDTLVIVTADHGHYLILERPEMLTGN